jgi:hypothetical protein
MAEDECCVIPKNDNDGVEDLTTNSSVGQRRQNVKALTLEGTEKLSNMLSMRRKKRNERIAEHVASSPRGSPLKTGSAGPQPVKKSCFNSKDSQESIIEDKNIDDENTRRSLSARNCMGRKVSVKSPTELVSDGNSSMNIKSPDNDYQRSKRRGPIRTGLKDMNERGSQECVSENGGNKLSRSRTPTRNSMKYSKVVNGRGNYEPGSPLKSGIPNGRGAQSPGVKKPVPGGRRPPSGSKKFSGVCTVSWSELAETSLITKPSAHLTTGRNVLYKDLNKLLEDNKNLTAEDKVRRLFYHFLLTKTSFRFYFVLRLSSLCKGAVLATYVLVPSD